MAHHTFENPLYSCQGARFYLYSMGHGDRLEVTAGEGNGRGLGTLDSGHLVGFRWDGSDVLEVFDLNDGPITRWEITGINPLTLQRPPAPRRMA